MSDILDPNEPATVEDVHAAYRLLLGRRADAEGFAGFYRQVIAGSLTVNDLAGCFLVSGEFYQRLARLDPVIERESDGLVFSLLHDGITLPTEMPIKGEDATHFTSFLRDCLEPGMVFVDVGASTGYFSAIASRIVGGSGRVHAIEPKARIVQLLHRTCHRNGITNLSVHAVAASNREALWWLAPKGTPTPIVGVGTVHQHEGFVQTRPLDLVLGALERLDLVHIDVDGFEGDVIEGMAALVQRFRPTVLVEWHPDTMASLGRELEPTLAAWFEQWRHLLILAVDQGPREVKRPKDLLRAWKDAGKAANRAGQDPPRQLDLAFVP